MMRFSLGKFMALAALLTVDFAWLRVLWSTRVVFFQQAPAGGYILEFGLLGMANVLALVVIVGPRRRGFLEAGVAAMLAYCGICLAWGEALLGRPTGPGSYGLLGISLRVAAALKGLGIMPTSLLNVFCFKATHTVVRVALLTTPQVIVAILAVKLGGRLTRREARRCDSPA